MAQDAVFHDLPGFYFESEVRRNPDPFPHHQNFEFAANGFYGGREDHPFLAAIADPYLSPPPEPGNMNIFSQAFAQATPFPFRTDGRDGYAANTPFPPAMEC